MAYKPKFLTSDWKDILINEFEKPYFQKIRQFLYEKINKELVYPKVDHIFEALNLTPFNKTKVIIIGQDPYHGEGQAHGLSFSVQKGTALPPSLKNIYKELCKDIDCKMPDHGCLESWARQGVLLLNATLTVSKGLPNSHQNLGWECFTNEIIKKINDKDIPCVFILWGKNAEKKIKVINNPIHYIIKSVHPSPLSVHRGFFGSKPFSKANTFLKSKGIEEIDWVIR